MPRTKAFHDLGPLPRRSTVGTLTTEKLLQVLRSLAIKNRREQAQVFYPLREVAKQFRVPISSVAKVYHAMEKEGLLNRVRGSKTILNGFRYGRRLSVRAFVGLPAIVSNFLTIPDCRRFFTCIQRELWLHDFAATMVFFHPDEAADGTLCDRLKTYHIDTVIWLHPGRSAQHSFLRLFDLGVRVISLSGIGTPTMMSRYFLWKERAVDALLRDWKDRRGFRKVIVVDSKEYRSPVTEEILRVVLATHKIEPVIRTFREGPSAAFLEDVCRTKTQGIIFPSAGLASLFAFQCPELVAELAKIQRLAFIDGPVDLPFTRIPDTPVDLVTFNWQAIAESIVSDLITLEAFDRNRYSVFNAEPHLKVPISSFCEPIRPTRSISSL